VPVGLDVSVKVQPVAELLGHIESQGRNLKPAFEIIGNIALTSIQRNFEEGGRPKKWTPLSEYTRRERTEEGYWPGQILVREGIRGGLLSSIYPQAFGDRVVLTARKVYAAAQHFGAEFVTWKAGRKGGRTVKIPPRPFMMLQREDWPEIRHALAGHLMRLGR